MKILFLDIDGVLNSMRTSVAFGGFPTKLDPTGAFDQAAICMLQRLCDSSGVQIVLSSSWRETHAFEAVGEAFGLPIIDRTPSLRGSRGQEIAAWLDAHPAVQTWAILDDEMAMLDAQLPRFVQVDGDNGLMWRDYLKLCEIFDASPHGGEARAGHLRTS